MTPLRLTPQYIYISADAINNQQRTTGAAGLFYRHGIKYLDVQVGNLSYPDSPIFDLAEFYHYISAAMNKHMSYSDGLGITLTEYNNDFTGLFNYSKNQGKAANIDLQWALILLVLLLKLLLELV